MLQVYSDKNYVCCHGSGDQLHVIHTENFFIEEMNEKLNH